MCISQRVPKSEEKHHIESGLGVSKWQIGYKVLRMKKILYGKNPPFTMGKGGWGRVRVNSNLRFGVRHVFTEHKHFNYL